LLRGGTPRGDDRRCIARGSNRWQDAQESEQQVAWWKTIFEGIDPQTGPRGRTNETVSPLWRKGASHGNPPENSARVRGISVVLQPAEGVGNRRARGGWGEERKLPSVPAMAMPTGEINRRRCPRETEAGRGGRSRGSLPEGYPSVIPDDIHLSTYFSMIGRESAQIRSTTESGPELCYCPENKLNPSAVR